MNFYMLVEGSRTEMKVYPAWFKILLPHYTQVEDIEDLKQNNYILQSGFGIPSIYTYIENTAQYLCLSNKIDYFIICMDLEGESEEDINKKVDQILEPYKNKMSAKRVVIIQKQCIETWFLGNASFYPRKIPIYFEEFHHFYNVKENDPEEMQKPIDFEGSIANYHLQYLAKMFRANNKNYGKRSTKIVEKEEYLNELISRVEATDHLSSFKDFLKICDLLKHS